jgi:hypothetical protein
MSYLRATNKAWSTDCPLVRKQGKETPCAEHVPCKQQNDDADFEKDQSAGFEVHSFESRSSRNHDAKASEYNEMKNRHKRPFRGLTQIRVSIISTATRDRLVRLFSKKWYCELRGKYTVHEGPRRYQSAVEIGRYSRWS